MLGYSRYRVMTLIRFIKLIVTSLKVKKSLCEYIPTCIKKFMNNSLEVTNYKEIKY
jgi:putative component of membrane protein insertase Oxa1/YidC/SpoIIIJ protein YidD